MHEAFGSDISHYQTLSVLGQCCQGLGVVELSKYVKTGKCVAIKRINLDKVRDDVSLIEQEIILTRQLKHPNIIKFLATFISGPYVCIISPLMGFGSCRDLLKTHFNEGLPENAIVFIVRDVLDALEYVHRRGIIHRAIRASHVFINEKGNSCLSGFRYSCQIIKNGKWQKKIHSFPLTTTRNLNWLSPELLEQNLHGYNEKSDIYSMGMLLTELANGSEPFTNTCTTLMLTEKCRGSAPQLLDCTTLPGQDEIHGDTGAEMIFRKQAMRKFSNGLHEIASLCLQREPSLRPTAGQLLTHPYFKMSKRSLQLPELLKPAIPIGENIVCNTSDEFQCFEHIQHLSDLEIHSCDWDFTNV